jgi:hypothetical protein
MTTRPNWFGREMGMLGVAGSSNVWLLVLSAMVFRLVVNVREMFCRFYCKGRTEVSVTCARTLRDVNNWIVNREIVNKLVESCLGRALKAVKFGQSGHCCPQHCGF